MKQLFIISLTLLLVLSGCKKDSNPDNSGTVTIDNKLYGTSVYYGLGFTFSTAKKTSTLNVPHPDLTIDGFSVQINNKDSLVLYFFSDNFQPSFSLYGTYPNASAASDAFKSLTSFSSVQWTDLGDNVNENQIWLYRNSANNYAKLRIVNTKRAPGTIKPDAECTFDWVYQPDGSATFPAQ